ncbi:SAM-dependent methyltransferase [Mycobacterium vulneris]|uniref:Methyltransferase domain-containing protein n=1 Tax=Mycolicibacterium porcinum TaxID=39693 RepID=A0AAW5T740_9MYCO|nr:methyltransferase domain-containing protein [Mycolicibacterium porcinum]OCB48498.1 SAM-dependent methyltransferase [Mycolicibacterium vulneris]MCV7390901.1 methyltransferase domain-containing protein [Mycolicibacterium porcinum]OCB57576.1 SAM-dependent methyltransferase [Mycolicibacterium vulneris]OCB68190.1 SAM-dependent methyltransferase [Mycolicibacterium vulneris]ORB35664.1 SAM-dependent methyltransferase [Mycolicibacterium porcinum]
MDTASSGALRKALDLLIDPPAEPDVGKGYLDLLGEGSDAPKNAGFIQKVWASPVGSMLYDNAQALGRKLMTAWQEPTEWLNVPPGGLALDVGSGPGNVTAALARSAGLDGFAFGVDISEPMLARAVEAEASRQVGFVRADAQKLPFRDGVFDAVVSIAAVQLIPDAEAALAEMVRVLRPGGRIAIMVPTATTRGPAKLLSKGGARFFSEDELGDRFEGLGLQRVRSKTMGTMQWVRGQKP